MKVMNAWIIKIDLKPLESFFFKNFYLSTTEGKNDFVVREPLVDTQNQEIQIVFYEGLKVSKC